jgi:hypothetical protein
MIGLMQKSKLKTPREYSAARDARADAESLAANPVVFNCGKYGQKGRVARRGLRRHDLRWIFSQTPNGFQLREREMNGGFSFGSAPLSQTVSRSKQFLPLRQTLRLSKTRCQTGG